MGQGSAPACCWARQQRGDAMTLWGQSTPDLATARTRGVVPSLPLWSRRASLLGVAVLATVASFAPFRGRITTSLVAWQRSWGPEPREWRQYYQIGAVAPWLTVVHEWNEVVDWDRWSYHSFHGHGLAVHLALLGTAWGAVIFLWGRRRDVTRGVPAAVEQAALARWAPAEAPSPHLLPPSGPPVGLGKAVQGG
jgi:hypothetical protein